MRHLFPLLACLALGGCAHRAAAADAPPAVLQRDDFDGENGERPALTYRGFRPWTVEEGTARLSFENEGADGYGLLPDGAERVRL